ncbi:MAG: trypsin-like peptidase domain-containing protein [Acutalibacteraceae bacterium]
MSEFEENQPNTEQQPQVNGNQAVQDSAGEKAGQPTEPTNPVTQPAGSPVQPQQNNYQPVNPQPVRRPVVRSYPPYQGNPSAPQQTAYNPGNPQYHPQPQTYVPAVYNNTAANNSAQQPATPPAPPKKQMSGTAKLIAGIFIGVAAVAVISLSSIGIYRAFSGAKSAVSTSGSDFSLSMAETPQTDTTIKGTEDQLTPAQVAAKVRPSIVSVITTDNISYNSANSSEGSGIILRSDGYIITNSHVIGDSNKYQVSVITSDGKTYDAKVIGYDTRSDLAVLKVNAKDLPACELGDSSKLVLGDYVIAIGNPGGVQFAGSITDGIVSGIDRIIDTDDMESTSAMRYIQTNAAINPGNSGGALVNMYGQVIGVNTSKISATGYEGMGFAIPSTTVKAVVDDLINYGYVQGRVKLGITCVTISSAYESQGIPAGLQIYSIDAESDLNGKAQVYDIITHCDGKRIKSLSQLQDIIFEKKPGDKVKLTMYRPATAKSVSSTYEITITLLEDTGATEEPATESDNGNNKGGSNSYEDFFSDFFGNGGRNY